METQMETDREAKAQLLRNRVRAAKDDGNTQLATEAIREIRGEKLWRELGFTSFNAYAKSCPYSSNYAYKMSTPLPVVDPPPNAFAAEDRTNMRPDLFIADTVKDPHGNELHGDMAKLFTNAKVNFDVLDSAIRQMQQTLRDLVTDDSGARFTVHSRMAGLMKHLHDIEEIVNDCRPYSVCISCSGNRRKCIACGSIGFINEQQYIDATAKRRRG